MSVATVAVCVKVADRIRSNVAGPSEVGLTLESVRASQGFPTNPESCVAECVRPQNMPRDESMTSLLRFR